MANIDELHFEVILKDDKFRQRINEDIKLAQSLNTSLSDALDFNKKIRVEPLKRVDQAFKNIEKSSRRTHQTQKQFNSVLGRSTNLMRTLSQLTGVAFSVVGVRRFLSTLIDVTGQFEVQKMALRNMLQDIDGANKIFEDLYNFSSKSTYRFSELAKYAKQLAAFNIDQESLLETTKMLGDVASGVGVSMDRVILAYGHVKSSGFLRGIQLRSFSQNGIPILEELSKMFTEIEGKAVSLGDVFDKMMKREITFEMVEEAFKRMTSEGGKFYQMQEVLAKTLAGQINILKGKWENLMYAMGESQEGVLKGVVQALTKIVSSTESFGKAVVAAIAILGGWEAAALIAAIATDTLTASQARFVAVLDKAVHLATNPYVYLAAAIAAVGVAVYKAATAMDAFEKAQSIVDKTSKKYTSDLTTEISELDALYAKLKFAKEGTEEYAAAKLAIEKRFNPYIEQLRSEGKEVNDLAFIYNDLANKIKEATKARYLESATAELGQENADEIAKLYRAAAGGKYNAAKNFYKAAGIKDPTAVQMEAYWQYVSGQMSEWDLRERARSTGGAELVPLVDLFNGTAGESWHKVEINRLRDQYKDAMDAYAGGLTEITRAYETLNAAAGGGGKETVEYTIDQIVKGINDADAELKRLRSNPNLSTADEKTITSVQAERDDWAKMYKTLMGSDYDKAVKRSSTEQANATKDRIQALKSEISILEKYYDARQKLEPYFGDQTNLQLARLFGARDYDSLDADLQKLINDLRALGDEGAQAADQIETRLGMDALSLVLKQQTALEKYQSTLADWMGEDYTASGTKVEYKAARIAAKFNEDSYKTQKKFNEAVKQAKEAHKGDAAAIDAEVKKLTELRDAELAYLKTKRDEDIAGLADQVYKEATRELDLTDWAHKSVEELENIREKLKNIELPAWVHEAFLYNPEGFEKFIAALKELADADIAKVDEHIDDEKFKNFRKYAEYVSQIADALMQLGKAAGSAELEDIGEALSFIAKTASSIVERLANDDVAGAVIAGITAVLSHIVNAISAAESFRNELAAINEEARRNGLSDTLKGGIDSIFGTNDLAKVRNANKVFAEIEKHQKELGNSPAVRYKKGFWDYASFGLFKHRSSIGDLAAQMGMDLYDAYGNLNATTLQAILDTYKGLGKAEKEWIQAAINDSEAYAEAMEQLEDVVQSVFGQIASSSSDKIVDSWKERRDAALDYADVLDDVATRYAKMMIESAMLDTVLDEDKAKSIVDKFAHGNAEAAMEQIAQDMATIQGMAPVWEQILQAFDPYFNRTSGETGDTLRDGINKELVEGNSSLIASYINAMRADLSVIRMMDSTGWQDVRLVRESMPSLVDYAAQVAANTFDNAQNTSAILSKLQSIITPSTNGGSAVRTTK